MKAYKLFNKIEEQIPIEMALNGDKVGFLGSEDFLDREVKKILVLMDYIPPQKIETLIPSPTTNQTDFSDDLLDDFDLLIIHHPPVAEVEHPIYVIHSNWDIIPGGACDTLADCLGIQIQGPLDPKTKLGRIGTIKKGPIPLDEFVGKVKDVLAVNEVKIVNDSPKLVENVALISGFGLTPPFIKMAHNQGVDLYLSGDLTHTGAILAKNLGITLLDATHHATEVPGLYKLGKLISEIGPDVQVLDTKIPWKTHL